MTFAPITEYLPHRDPFLFVKQILSLDEGRQKITFTTFFSAQDPVFLGHFPNNPIVPGVLILEAAAQGSIILLKGLGFVFDFYYLVGVDDATFKGSAKPDEELIIESTLIAHKLGIFKSGTQVFKNDKLIARATISCKATNQKI